MKVLIVGASGMIGGEALIQCLVHPSISSVIAFVRRDLPANVRDHPKLQSVLIKDFAVWPKDVLQAHADAVGMIWAMGSYDGSITADLEYPLAFLEAMAPVLKAQPSRPRFRCVHLSGKFVRQNQEQKLWFMEKPRKMKGLLETKALAFAENHAAIWETFIVKPGGVVPKKLLGAGVLGVATGMGAVMGENWSVRNDELGAFMIHLAINGEGEEPVTENGRIVRKGKELLKQAELK
ncbi:hypothetical protein B0J13DRAFT_108922 [Dactylonectria estremocensis]|uniref:NAD(P)-binding domain-containing protein n=1 Tax=Dactylonectria estremocensis TaxID=1079267 RepID=A0A9P9FBV7_9HYPO|nr:hypothetical protein B0J13DRAFT_108922 [Dactylonectria estremocensis]